MESKMKYETPEIEVTRFEANKEVMNEDPTHQGDIVTFDAGGGASNVEVTNEFEWDE